MKIPYLVKKRLKNGRIAYYFNLPARSLPEGCNIKCSQALGCDYFTACEKALKLNKQLNEFRQEKTYAYKSLDWIWEDYAQSRFYKNLKPRTVQSYEYVVERMGKIKSGNSGKLFSSIPLDQFNFDAAYNLYEKFVVLFKKTQALYCITVLKLLYNYGLSKGYYTKKNPFENLRIKKPKPKKSIIPQEHLNMLIDRAYEMNMDFVALAIELNYYFAQRNADVLKLRKENIYKKGGNYFFDIVQNKTDKEVRLPIPPQLVNKVLTKEDYIICDSYGCFTTARFSRYFKKVRDSLGFNYVFKNMRHTASTAYVEAGVNATSTISITGHTNESTFNQIYKADTDEISLMALRGRLKAESQNKDKKQSE